MTVGGERGIGMKCSFLGWVTECVVIAGRDTEYRREI